MLFVCGLVFGSAAVLVIYLIANCWIEASKEERMEQDKEKMISDWWG